MQDGKTEAIVQTSNDESLQKLADKPFSPTGKMKRWLETTLELGYSASLSEIQRKTGISREAYYKWLNKDGFIDWWDAQWQKNLKAVRWQLDAIGIKNSKDNYKYWHDMMNRAGNTIPEASSIGQQINTQFNIPNANMERIDR